MATSRPLRTRPSSNELIDLGEDFQPVGADRAVRRPSRRNAVLAALVLVAVVVLGGAAPSMPAVARVGDVPVNPGAVAMAVGNRLLVAEVRDGTNELNGYSLTTAKRLWSSRLSVLTHGSFLERVGGVLVVSYVGGSISGDMTNAVDIRTGRLLWRSTASFRGVNHGHLILLSADTSMVTSVDPVTGSTVWSFAIDQRCDYDVSVAYVEVCANSGQMRVIDLETGAMRGSRRVDVKASVEVGDGVPEAPGIVSIVQGDGVVIVGRNTTSRPILEGFSATTLEKLWSRTVSALSSLTPCGAVFCMFDDQVAAGLDPRTGADMPFPGYDAIDNVDLQTFKLDAGPVGLDTRYTLIPLRLKPDRHGNYPGATALQMVADSQAVVIPFPTNLDTFLASIDPVTRTERVLFRVEGAGVRSCSAMARYLLCELTGNTLRIWKLNG